MITSIIIDVFHDNETLMDRISKLMQSSAEIFITPIMLCELYKGVYGFSDPEKELNDLEDFIFNFDLLDFDKEACKEFGRQYSRLKKIGKLTQETDLMIASIAKANGLIVVTRNKKHFENIDVKIEIW